MDELQALHSILKRERQARKAAEQLIEEKSRELFYANEALKKLNENLEETVQQRTQELEEQRDRAEAATRVKSDFLSSISHELRTPLNAISGLAELINRDSEEKTSREYAGVITDSVRHLLGIINEILDFSKIESGTFALEPEVFSWQDIQQQLQHTFGPMARRKNLAFSIETDPNLPHTFFLDRTKFFQVWTNLIGNAIKFTQQGSIIARLQLLRQTETAFWLQGQVQDSGVGIAEEYLDKIFAPFEQVKDGSQGSTGGTGLGLAISRRIVDLMGGTIEVSSDIGQGTTFTVQIPVPVLADPERMASPKLANTKDWSRYKALAGRRVLVVDDLKVNRYLMQKVLSRMDIHPSFAIHGAESLELCQQETFDLILMDLHMPIMDGPTATRRIRAGESIDPNVPIVALTADAFQHTQERIVEAGMNAFLTKPVDIDQLYEVIHNIIHVPS